MEKKSLEIHTATIEIHVIKVDGHKMTKATFRQIPSIRRDYQEMYYQEMSLISDVLGYVLDDAPWLVFSYEGEIVRMNIAGWGIAGWGYEEKPLTDFYPQLYIAT